MAHQTETFNTPTRKSSIKLRLMQANIANCKSHIERRLVNQDMLKLMISVLKNSKDTYVTMPVRQKKKKQLSLTLFLSQLTNLIKNRTKK